MSEKTLSLIRAAIYFFLFFVLTGVSGAAPLFNVPIQLKQPDGNIINVLASGDEYYHWVHDKDNYTITIDNKTGYYVYAQLADDKLIPSGYIVGKVNPLNTNLAKGVNISPYKIKDLRLRKQPVYSLSKKTNLTQDAVSNLVIFIRFSDEDEFNNNISFYENYFNSVSNPSLKNYYNEVSWGELDIQSYFYPAPASGKVISYKDIHPRNYYLKYNSVSNPDGYQDSEAGPREEELLLRALASVKTQIPASLNLDKNDDGNIDNVCFIVSGDPAGWSDLLWPHMSYLYGQDFYINNKKVFLYNFQLQNSLAPSVLCHEMGHTLGAPDLYPYDYLSNPVGQWDIMALGYGTHMLNYNKFKYFGWISDIPEITTDGTYSLKPSSSQTNNLYKIKSPRGDYESFILEYRVKEGYYESNIPSSGLIVYRVNEKLSGNVYAPPYEIYVYRPNGNYNSDGSIDKAAFSKNAGRTAINDTTNPSSFLSDGGPGGLNIFDISALGDSITFSVKIIDKMPDYAEPYSAEVNNYNWYDISKTGTIITNWKNGLVTEESRKDDGYTPVPIPLGFDFNYFGQTFDSLYVGVNGLVSFTKKVLNSAANSNELGYFAETSWPGNILFPNSIAVAYYDFDLNPYDTYGGGRVLYKTIGSKFILSWENIGTFLSSGDTTNTFQLVLDKETSSVTLNYKKFGLNATRSVVKIGMQGVPPIGVSWIENGLPSDRMPQDNSSVTFKPAATTGIDDNKIAVNNFILHQNYPNPFNPVTTIQYSIPAPLALGSQGSRFDRERGAGGEVGGSERGVSVTLKVYDILGNEVATLVNKEQSAGTYRVKFNASNLSTGVYFYRLHAGSFVETKKLVLLK